MGAARKLGNWAGDVVGGTFDTALDVVGKVGDFAINAIDAVMEDPVKLLPLALAVAVPGAGAAIGASLGATGTAASALGGAVIGGTTSALTGGDPLTGALLGGAGGYASGALGATGGSPTDIFTDTTADFIPSTDFGAGADYGFSSGKTIGGFSAPPIGPGLDIVGNIPFEGFQPIVSPALKSMGSGQGLTATTPKGAVGQLGLTPTGASPILGDPSSFINNPNVLGTSVVQADPAYAAAEAADKARNDAFLKAFQLGAIGLMGAPSMPITPTVAYQQPNTMPVYTPEYFQAVQQNYNTMLPALPKDVISPLQEIYTPKKSIVETLFGAT